MALDYLPSPSWAVIYGETPSATRWSELGENDDSLATGAGIDDSAIITRHHANDSVTPQKWTNPYNFSAWYNGSLSITNQTLKVPLNSESFDTNNNFDSTTNNRYVAPVTGQYYFFGQVWLGVAGSGTNEAGVAYIYKNGVAARESDKDNGSGNSDKLIKPKIGALLNLTAGDYIELYAYFQGSRNIQGSQNSTFLDGFLVNQA